MENEGNAGRVPQQRRSRERVERILEVATELIAARGSDALRMSEIAEQAGVSIGSLYQYFPDRSAVVRALAERYNAQGLHCAASELAGVEAAADLAAALGRVADGYHAMFRAEPVMRDIAAATRADRALQAVDAADRAAHAALLADVLARLYPGADPADLSTRALLLTEMTAAAVRLAVATDGPQADQLLGAFRRMLPGCLAALDATG